MTDSESGIKSTYYYDLIDRLCRYEEAGQDYSFIMEYEFNDRNQVSQMVQTIDGNRRPIEITYDDDGRVTSYRKAEVTESYGYDNLGRLATKTTALDTATRLTETLTYRTNSSGNETGQVNTISINAPSGYHIYFTYGYDMNGNIAFVKSGDMTTNYTYDSAGQLIREDNQAQGKSWTWVYDNAGNILSKKEYAYTTGTLGTATDTVSYVYDTGSWGDLLTSFDGQAITYDNIGNPRTIGNRSFTWKHGRELATLTENGVTWTNTYNADGLRISRTNGSLTYKYYYFGGQLVRIGVGSKYLDISYDASGVPMALYYSGYQVDNAHYYYVTNLQGDVVAILNEAGTAVVTYTYDAWGNILTVGGTMADTLGVYNPLRYRGYVYDEETSLYYLQSRYYDPNMGRFLNADAFASTGQGFGGNNMFAYCLNNPTFLCDPSGNNAVTAPASGYNWEWILGLLPLLDGPSPVLDGLAIGVVVVAGVLICSTSSSAETEAKAEAVVVDDTSYGPYSVYYMCACGDSSRTIVYVGRVITANFNSRMTYHNSKGRELVHAVHGLYYDECRALEQAGMMCYHTINRDSPVNNQIRGISPRNVRGKEYMSAGMKFAQSNRYKNDRFLPQSYWDNLTEEAFLNGGI